MRRCAGVKALAGSAPSACSGAGVPERGLASHGSASLSSSDERARVGGLVLAEGLAAWAARVAGSWVRLCFPPVLPPAFLLDSMALRFQEARGALVLTLEGFLLGPFSAFWFLVLKLTLVL